VQGYSRNGTGAWPTGTAPEETGVGLAKWYVDHDYIRTLDMEVIEGRDFSIDMPTDSQAIILNRKAVEMLGFDDPIGKQVTSFTYLDSKTGKLLDATYTVIGVIENFHYESMKQNIEGLSLVIGTWASTTMIKASTADTQKLLQTIETTWSVLVPDQPFRYHFLDERFARMYAFEQRIGQIFTVFTGLAIFVACLGLFALATFTAEQRSKEISIRKVLGASVSNITLTLTKNFARLVLIALIIAIPIAWWLMQSWLQGFAYRTAMGWSVFLLSGSITLLIALLTVSYQAIRAALANPADILKSGS
jgi:putative ABC transport system permease protein